MALVNLLWVDKFFWDGRSPSLEDQARQPIEDPTEMNLPIAQAAAKLQGIGIYPPQFEKAFGSSTITPENIQKALAQFERTLISENSKFDQFLKEQYRPTEQEMRGIRLFQTHPVWQVNLRGGNCGDCHGAGALTTLNTFHNNGLETTPSDLGRELITGNLSDRGKMRAPSLRNIALTAPYMHDGRFKTLKDVLDHYNEHIQNGPYLDILIKEASNLGDNQPLGLTEQEKADILVFLDMLTDSTFVTDKRFSDPF
ncbi:MAG: cytochrome-c peroxidase [Lewinella sp.]|nr:cytochrome-c peroxidase [Lewinella sp.]